ncbi:MAG: heme o synthase, partial [Myxococcota bacterium]|nr:heme o synthase [Myxococcota bacterium]
VIITAAGGWWLAPSRVDWRQGLIAVMGTTITVGAANSLNNYLERESDKFMARTQNRPLPKGRLSPKIALVFGLFLSAISIPMLTLFSNPLSGLLAGIALVFYVMIYTPLKRKSSFNTLVGAIPGAMPPLIGWTAATYSIDWGGIVLFALLFLWQIPHSLAITIYREKEYKSAGIVVLPSVQGLHSTRFQMLFYTVALLPIPPLLFLTGVSGWATLTLGTAVGLWWAYKAWFGFAKEGKEKWARKFFLASLVYLSIFFVLITVDKIIAGYVL